MWRLEEEEGCFVGLGRGMRCPYGLRVVGIKAIDRAHGVQGSDVSYII